MNVNESSARTHWPPIRKELERLLVQPNLLDYESARAAFSWRAARAELDGLPGGG